MSVAGELAVLMLENQENQKQAEREQLAIARQEFSSALSDQVEALRAQADAKLGGALFQAGMSLGASGLGLSATAEGIETPWKERMSATASGLQDVAPSLAEMIGSNYGAADAKSAEGAQAAAKWQMDDAREAINDADALQDKALEWLGSVVDQDAATMSAILSNKV